MKPLTAIILIGGGALLVSAIAKTAMSAYSLQFGIADADVSCGGILCTQPEILLKIRVQNPGPGSFTINSLAGNFTFNGTQAGNISSFTQMELPRYSEILYPATVRITLATLLSNISGIFEGGIKGELGINGSINVSGLQLPVITSYRLI